MRTRRSGNYNKRKRDEEKTHAAESVENTKFTPLALCSITSVASVIQYILSFIHRSYLTSQYYRDYISQLGTEHLADYNSFISTNTRIMNSCTIIFEYIVYILSLCAISHLLEKHKYLFKNIILCILKGIFIFLVLIVAVAKVILSAKSIGGWLSAWPIMVVIDIFFISAVYICKDDNCSSREYMESRCGKLVWIAIGILTVALIFITGACVFGYNLLGYTV